VSVTNVDLVQDWTAFRTRVQDPMQSRTQFMLLCIREHHAHRPYSGLDPVQDSHSRSNSSQDSPSSSAFVAVTNSSALRSCSDSLLECPCRRFLFGSLSHLTASAIRIWDQAHVMHGHITASWVTTLHDCVPSGSAGPLPKF